MKLLTLCVEFWRGVWRHHANTCECSCLYRIGCKMQILSHLSLYMFTWFRSVWTDFSKKLGHWIIIQKIGKEGKEDSFTMVPYELICIYYFFFIVLYWFSLWLLTAMFFIMVLQLVSTLLIPKCQKHIKVLDYTILTKNMG